MYPYYRNTTRMRPRCDPGPTLKVDLGSTPRSTVVLEQSARHIPHPETDLKVVGSCCRFMLEPQTPH